VRSTDEPFWTVTSQGSQGALVAPVLTEHANASTGRTFDPQQPLRTQCAEVKGGHFALVQAFLAKHYTGVVGSDLKEPIGTVTSTDHHSLVTATLAGVVNHNCPPGRNAPQAAVAAHVQQILEGAFGVPNVTSIEAAHLTKFRTGSTGSELSEPMHTVTAGPKENPAGAAHAMGLVRAFLVKYYGNEKDAHGLPDPIGTVTTKDRFGLVTVNGEEFAIADIGLRMLAPRELFRAQGFPEGYRIGDRPGAGLTLTKSAQVRMCGNSVCPPLACALVAANVPEMATWTAEERRVG
jgi:DNA (cytosine-5)-methyltransferase 1